MGDTDSRSINAEPKNTSPAEDLIARVITFSIILGSLYFIFVWKNLPLDDSGGNSLRWGITGGILGVAILILIFAGKSKFKVFEAMSKFIIIIFIVLGAAIFSIYFIADEQIILFKLFVIAYFSFLPAWLYLHFISIKGRTLWEEYVLNLFRLGVDQIKHLPEPPVHSIYHDKWITEHQNPVTQSKTTQGTSQYIKKFEGVFGPVHPGNNISFASFRGENLWPVAIATLLISVGWVLVTQPESVFNKSILPSIPITHNPTLPLEAIYFGFLGAYFYILQMLVRRYFQNDLKTSAYLSSTVRIIVVFLLVWVISLGWNNPGSQRHLAVLAFIIGVFPHVGWQALLTIVKLPIKTIVPSLKQKFPLNELDGLNIWYESRLLEEGIEDMQNLATANLVDVMLNTRIPIERLVDWVDQSILYLHLGDGTSPEAKENRHKLRLYGIRGATDLIDAFKSREKELIHKLERLLNKNDTEPSKLRTILATFKHEPNLRQVQNWKSSTGNIDQRNTDFPSN